MVVLSYDHSLCDPCSHVNGRSHGNGHWRHGNQCGSYCDGNDAPCAHNYQHRYEGVAMVNLIITCASLTIEINPSQRNGNRDGCGNGHAGDYRECARRGGSCLRVGMLAWRIQIANDISMYVAVGWVNSVRVLIELRHYSGPFADVVLRVY